ncbi:sulfatase-like hydrolase/transferase [Myxococcota bacterium]|nr:sulfatase-like hydrolase/transferase [Myxococcota bacterium]
MWTAPLWLLACASSPSPPTTPADAPAKDVVLIVIDTLRADALGPANTPTLDALAARGEAATVAWSGGTWTVPSVISLFTGAPVRQHGWDGPTGQQGRYPKLPALPTLAETFRAAGFTTIGLYANGYLAEELGFDSGFDVWRRVPDAAMPKALAETLAALPPDPDRRHLVYLPLLGPHSTLRPSEEAAARHGVTEAVTAAGRQGLDIGAVARARRDPSVAETYRRAYHAVVEDTDARLAALLEAMGPMAEHAAIVVTSDHGELIGERGLAGHGAQLFAPLTQVPYVAVNVAPLPPALSTVSTAARLSEAAGLELSWPVVPALPLVAQREGALTLSLDGETQAIWRDGESAAVYSVGVIEAAPRADDGRFERARAAWEAVVPEGERPGEAEALRPGTEEALRGLGYLD